MVAHHRRLSSLSPSEITHLAALLALPLRLLDPATGRPSDLWLATQERLISLSSAPSTDDDHHLLPKPLLRPHDFFSRLSMSANRHLNLAMDELIPECAVLCASHAGLNPWLLRRVFMLVTEEVTARTVSLERYLARPGRYKKLSSKLDGEAVVDIRNLVDRMHALLSLSTAPMVLERIGCPADMRFPMIEGGCEACVVAVVGGSARALCDLRAALVGRTHHGRHHRKTGPPALLRLVDAWIERLGEEGEDQVKDIVAESDRLGRVVKRVRRAVWKGRRVGDAPRSQYHGRDEHHHHHHRCSRRSSGSATSTDQSISVWGGQSTSILGSSTQACGSSPHEKREHQRALMEGSIAEQRLSSQEKVVMQERIEEQLDGMFGPESRYSGSSTYSTGKPSSSSASSSFTSTQSRQDRGRADGNTSERHTIDDNTHHHQQRHKHASDHSSHSYGRSSRADTIANLIDLYYDDEVDGELDDSDPDAADRLQDSVQTWWDTFSEVCEQHPALRSSVSQPAVSRMPHRSSAMPLPLHVKKSTSNISRADDEEPFDPSQWTDISVRTSVMPFAAGTRSSNHAPSLPEIPARFRFPFLGGDERESPTATYASRSSTAASSVYSNNEVAIPHPPPPPLCPVMVESDIRSNVQSIAGSIFMSQITAPETYRPPRVNSATVSDITAWPSPLGPEQHAGGAESFSTGSHRSGFYGSSSARTSRTSNTYVSAEEFQSGLHGIDGLSLGQTRTPEPRPTTLLSGGEIRIPDGTVLPEDSITTVGGLLPPVSQPRNDDEGFAWRLALQEAMPAPCSGYPAGRRRGEDDGEEMEMEMEMTIPASNIAAGEDESRRMRWE